MKVLKAGTRAKCAVCDTEVMVVRTPATGPVLACGGVEMLDMAGAKTPGAHGASDLPGTLLGKRYVTAAGDVELLCTKGGKGQLSVNGETLAVKEAKPLPSSD
ncbi:MAG: hypothetical protein FJ191_00700 [Gammaproteobacteria bacterium]|nr:hypothetical protein [Gammaproteobacteria bacterium]